jgi:hypothetical protein
MRHVAALSREDAATIAEQPKVVKAQVAVVEIK